MKYLSPSIVARRRGVSVAAVLAAIRRGAIVPDVVITTPKGDVYGITAKTANAWSPDLKKRRKDLLPA